MSNEKMIKNFSVDSERDNKLLFRKEIKYTIDFKSGKTKEEIKDYLVSSLGLNENDANKLISEVLSADSVPKNMYE